MAGSRLTETIMPKEIVDALKPEYVSPLVAWLCHESCEENGGIFEVGGGFIGKLRWERTVGKLFPIGRPLSVEQVQGAWSAVTDFEKATHPENVHAALQPVLANLEKKSKGGNEFIDVDAALGYTMDGLESKYDERDLALYALGVGAGKNPTDEADLHLVYERNGEGFYALPTYGVIPAINATLTMALEGKGAPGLNYSLDRILHGVEHRQADVILAGLARGHAADQLGAVIERLLGVEGALRASETLTDHPRLLVDQNCHDCSSTSL